jgi:hypothetical protein
MSISLRNLLHSAQRWKRAWGLRRDPTGSQEFTVLRCERIFAIVLRQRV